MVVNLPDEEPAEQAEPMRPIEDLTVLRDSWDPVEKVQYFTDLDHVDPADDLILETRRQITPTVDDAG